MSTECTILEHPDLVIALTESSARFTLDVYSKVDGPDGKRQIDICVEIGEVENLQAFSDEIGAFADAYSQENRGAVRLREDVVHLKAENERLLDENAKLRRQLDATRADGALVGEQMTWIKNALGWSGTKLSEGHLWQYAEQVKKHNEQMATALLSEAGTIEEQARRCPGEPTKSNMFRHAIALRALAAGGAS